MSKYSEKYIMGVITFLFSLPFLLVSSDYQDDIYRSSSGDSSFWFQNGRPISVYLLQAINQGGITPDVFPLTTILSFMVLGVTSYLICNELFPSDKGTRLASFCILIANPFFLQNLSYKYDCITMALCLYLSYVFVFKFCWENVVYSALAKSVAVFLLLCLYQPALSYMAGLIAISLLTKRKESAFSYWGRMLLFDAAIILLTFVIYKHLVSDAMLNEKYKEAGSLIHLDSVALTKLIHNYFGYLQLAWKFLSKPLVLTTAFASLIIFIYVIVTQERRFMIRHVTCASMLLVSLTSVNITLNQPNFHPREMVGFSLMFVYFVAFSSKVMAGRRVATLSAAAFIFTSFSISCYLSNMRNLVTLRDGLIVNDVVSSMYRYDQDKINTIAFINNSLDILPSQTAILRSNPLVYNLLGGVNFMDDWYSRAIINQKYNIQKQVMSTNHIPYGLEWRKGCYTKTALSGGVMFVEVGIFCN